MVPRPPAFETAAARGPEDVRAIPARRMGYSIARSSHSGVFKVGRDIAAVYSMRVIFGSTVYFGGYDNLPAS